MKKFDFSQTISILANIGVIAGIVFLGFELRQNTNAIRGTTIQAISEQSYDTSMRVAENADLRAAQRAAVEGNLTEDQRAQLNAFYSGLMKIQANRFEQARLGNLEEEAIFQVGGKGDAYRSPFFSDFWAESKAAYSIEFQEFVEREVLPLSIETH